MGFSAIYLVKTLTSTGFSLYQPAVTACERLFQQGRTPQVGPPSTFQHLFYPVAQKWRISGTGFRSINRQKKYVYKQKDVNRILNLPGEP
jgi:hypothetical protein